MGVQTEAAIWKSRLAAQLKLSTHAPQGQAAPSWATPQKGFQANLGMCTRMFLTALFMVVERWGQSEWIRRACRSCIGSYEVTFR